TEERAWRVGADGEELVAAQLERLGPAWKTLHAVPVGSQGSDIDHVLIGPGGIYTINTKHHPGASVWVGGNTVLVNGSKTWYVRNSRYEARRAAELLSARVGVALHVTGLIAIISDRTKFTVKSQPPGGDVHVLARRKVADWLSHRGQVLTAAQVDAVFQVARRSTTWTG
ncbi:MAG TPA: nuclease-related domain-containing protein, partial [Jatrophihabitans sp.]